MSTLWNPLAKVNILRGTGWLILPLVVVALALIACTGQTQSSNSPTPRLLADPGNPVYATDFPITVYQGEEMLGGSEIWLSQLLSRDLAQRKPIILNFWAGLCPPCRIEMPDLQGVHEEYRDRVLLLGIDVGPFTGLGSREDGRGLLEELRVTYPNGTTFDSEVLIAYSVLGMPTTVFITPTGVIVEKWIGLLNKDKMTELVKELLASSSGS